MTQRPGQGGGQHLAQWGMGVAGQPLQRAAQFAGQQWGLIQDLQRCAQFAGGRVRFGHGDDHPDQFAISERHPDPPAHVLRAGRMIGRRQVVEGLPQRNRHGDAERQGRGHGVQV